ncbi:amidohydrolase family protein [candidate division KSB1 bacterium]|nr:amidohydrolase family protein [candidate division KSB1 bacterium]
MELTFFDCNCLLGRHIDHVATDPYTKRELLEDMAYFGISDCLVIHARSKDNDPLLGNQTVLDECRDEPHLYPVWVLLPPATGEMESPEILAENIGEKNIRAAALYPKLHSFSIADWTCGSLLDMLSAKAIPLLIDISQISWDEINQLCAEYPELSVILTSASYRSLRYLAPLWEKTQNLYVDTSWLTISDGFEWVVKNYGPKRLVFGTRYPIFMPGGAITALTYANLENHVKGMIASENLKELLFL